MLFLNRRTNTPKCVAVTPLFNSVESCKDCFSQLNQNDLDEFKARWNTQDLMLTDLWTVPVMFGDAYNLERPR